MKRMLVLFSLALAWSTTTPAAEPVPPSEPASSAAPVAEKTFRVGTLRVERYGAGEPALILIPGLGSGSWVWQDTIAAFADDHAIYAVTLAGFDGIPPPAEDGNWMQLAEDSLRTLIEQRDLDQPALIGHSLGGTLAIAFASRHPELPGAVVAVDGLPVFPGTENLTPEQRQARAKMFAAQMSAGGKDAFAAQQLRYMQMMGVLDPDAAKHYAQLQARSDPDAIARYAAEDLQLDLRPELASIEAPVLVISPYYAKDFERAAASGRMPMMSEQDKADYYASLFPGVEDLEVISIAPARHFVMLDQPQQFHDAIEAFLASLPRADEES